MRPKLRDAEPITIEEFLEFTETRPDGEYWELIEGVPVVNPSPVDHHQVIALNIGSWLRAEKVRLGLSWLPLLGIGTRVPVSPNSLPRPDVFVLEGPTTGTSVTDDALVLFEVLSRSNTRADQEWRRRVYASIPNCRHYVTVAVKTIEITRYDRAEDWSGTKLTTLGTSVLLDALGVEMPLSEVYRWTPLGSRD